MYHQIFDHNKVKSQQCALNHGCFLTAGFRELAFEDTEFTKFAMVDHLLPFDLRFGRKASSIDSLLHSTLTTTILTKWVAT